MQGQLKNGLEILKQIFCFCHSKNRLNFRKFPLYLVLYPRYAHVHATTGLKKLSILHTIAVIKVRA